MKTRRLVEYDCFFCDVCREYVYNELLGEPTNGVSPKTHVDELPSTWQCPVCGAGKENLRASTLLDGFTYEDTANGDAGKVAKPASETKALPTGRQ